MVSMESQRKPKTVIVTLNVEELHTHQLQQSIGHHTTAATISNTSAHSWTLEGAGIDVMQMNGFEVVKSEWVCALNPLCQEMNFILIEENMRMRYSSRVVSEKSILQHSMKRKAGNLFICIIKWGNLGLFVCLQYRTKDDNCLIVV